MATTEEAGVAAISVPRQTLEDALVAHLTEKVFENPEERNALIRGLITEVLSHREHPSDKQSFMMKFLRQGIADKVKVIAGEWIEAHRDIIEAQVEAALQENIVAAIVHDLAKAIGDRISRGY